MMPPRWRLLRPLGRGYSATTFLAEDTTRPGTEPVALKVAPLHVPEGSDDRGPAWEVEVLRRLDHRHLVGLRGEPEVLDHDGIASLAIPLEWCDGSLLGSMERSDTSELLAEVVPQVIAGLAEVHRRHLVHRDVNPQNVLCRDGVWKLGDFGLCRPVDEVASGAAPDVFCLGRLVHYCLTGSWQPGVPAESTRPQRAQIRATRRLPQPWEPFVLASMQPDPADRPSLGELVALVPAPLPVVQDRRPIPVTPVVVTSSMVDGHQEEFSLDADGSLRHRWRWHRDPWSPWDVMPAPPLVGIAAGSHGPGDQHVVAVTTDGRVVARWNWMEDDATPGVHTPSRWTDPWVPFAGSLPDGRLPASVATRPTPTSPIEVSVVDTGGDSWQCRWVDGFGWSPWS